MGNHYDFVKQRVVVSRIERCIVRSDYLVEKSGIFGYQVR